MTTFTVMASGNTGQENNFRYAQSDVPNLVFVSSIGSNGLPAKYSGYTGPTPDYTAYAFGGDDPTIENGMGIFHDDRQSYGTSYAALGSRWASTDMELSWYVVLRTQNSSSL
jgi:hypothetical protein